MVKVPEKKLKMTARNTQDTVTKSRLTSHVVAIRVGMLGKDVHIQWNSWFMC